MVEQITRDVVWWIVDLFFATGLSPFVVLVGLVAVPVILLAEKEWISEHVMMLASVGLMALAFVIALAIVYGGAGQLPGISG